MKDFSAIIKRLLFGETPQTWICIPKYMTKKNKRIFIKNTLEFLEKNVIVKIKL